MCIELCNSRPLDNKEKCYIIPFAIVTNSELIQVGCCHVTNRLQAMLSEKDKMELTQKNINSLKYDHKLVTSDARSPSSPGVCG